jgi:hypothetical protein
LKKLKENRESISGVKLPDVKQQDIKALMKVEMSDSINFSSARVMNQLMKPKLSLNEIRRKQEEQD